MQMPYQKAYFLLSVADQKQLPQDRGIEIAIFGRSNAGKSSVINCITQNKHLARVSKTPGRTQHINMFVIDEKRRLADLPGYGYAKVPLAIKKQWHSLVDAYVRSRESLKGAILVMDIRHPLTDLDAQFLTFCDHAHLPVHILLNKADKLSQRESQKIFQEVKAALTPYCNSVTLQVFSALKGTGVKELYRLLNEWYGF